MMTLIAMWIPDRMKQFTNRNKVDVVIVKTNREQSRPGPYTLSVDHLIPLEARWAVIAHPSFEMDIKKATSWP